MLSLHINLYKAVRLTVATLLYRHSDCRPTASPTAYPRRGEAVKLAAPIGANTL